ncbi:MAG: sugar phosphate isomerase/epimerase [Firmicutes bacterium]|nr:sugar phosphate isomerase/epimerase [Bacillota bacterium]
MKICVSMWSLHREFFQGRMDVVDFIKWTGTTAAEGVELLDVFWKDQAREIPAVKAALAEANLTVGCYAVSNNFVTDAAARAEQVEIIRRGVDMAVEFGAPVVRVFAGDLAEDISFDDARQWIIDGLREAAAYAAEHRITLSLENHGKLAGRSDQIIGILKDVGSDYLKATVDLGNFLLVDEDPAAAVTNLAPYAAHVHFKDFRPYREGDSQSYQALSGQRFVGTIAGEGGVDLKHALTELKAASYQGWLSVEFEGLEDEKLGTIQSVNNLVDTLEVL